MLISDIVTSLQLGLLHLRTARIAHSNVTERRAMCIRVARVPSCPLMRNRKTDIKRIVARTRPECRTIVARGRGHCLHIPTRGRLENVRRCVEVA
jgi:hypothetical protein